MTQPSNPPKSKLGLIVECGPLGADLKVFRHVIETLRPDLEIVPITLDNKKKLVADCGTAAQLLLKQGCKRVVIVWDLFPAWREDGQKPCRKEDRQNVFDSLGAAGVPKPAFESPDDQTADARQVFLVCIQEELEAWLLADHQAIAQVLSKPTHKVRIAAVKNPETVDNPKKRLARFFKQAGQEYNDRVHAERVIKAVTDLRRLARACPTFARFALHAANKIW